MLEANGVSRSFRRGRRTFEAVHDVTLKLTPGTLTAVVGRSGSGKSTLLNLLGGLLTPTEGSVLLNGQDLYRLSDAALSRLRNQKISVIPQGQSVLHSLTVLENVLLPYTLYPDGENPARRAQELLERMRIGALASAWPCELSGGELRRVSIARALVQQPEVILADEPTSDLDRDNSAAVIGLLRQAADEGTAVLLVTHELETLKDADTVYRMDGGGLSLT